MDYRHFFEVEVGIQKIKYRGVKDSDVAHYTMTQSHPSHSILRLVNASVFQVVGKVIAPTCKGVKYGESSSVN